MAQSGSFIPQQTNARPTKVRRHRVYILSYIVYTIFVGTFLTTIGVIIWNWQLVSDLEAQQAALAAERTKFDQSDIIEVQEAESLFVLVEYLLDHQPAVSKLLRALEETTVQDVQLKEFAITSSEQSEEMQSEATIEATYTGYADSFNTVLAQRNVMESNSLLEDAVISDVSYGAETDTSAEQTTTAPDAPVSYAVTLRIPVADIMFAGLVLPSDIFDSSTGTTTAVEGTTSEAAALEQSAAGNDSEL